MVKISTSYDRAVHSDFLIHWTGKDIDEDLQLHWYDTNHHSKTDPVVTDRYLCRLRDILTYGLWMTYGEDKIRAGSRDIPLPVTPQCCFTELKLSESRRHAARYGRLGIGVKRPFLFERSGRPLTYFGYGEQSQNDRFLEACSRDLKDRSLMHFFKPMNSTIRPLMYDFYSESEWRILFFEKLLMEGKVIVPRDNVNTEAYFDSLTAHQRNTLKYLIPLDGWFAMIIYPSLAVKNAAQWNAKYGIAEPIQRIKSDSRDRGNRVEAPEDPTWGNWPIELDLDACRHF